MKFLRYTRSNSDCWSNFFDKEQFMGINCEGFHDWVTRKANYAVDAIGGVYSKAKKFVGRQWYVIALPLAMSIGLGMYATLAAVKPDVESAQVENVKKRRKSHVDYWMKYYFQGRQNLRKFTETLDDRVGSER